MNEAIHISSRQFQYIARISHGKDSMKMLDVIVLRGLPLDRITTTDIWATDTIRGEHPKMVEFKDMADEYIWRKYRIEVEHLCAMRNGEKVTYEKLFYHTPKRKIAGGHWSADNSENAGGGDKKQGTILGFPTLWGPWCQSDLKRVARKPHPGFSCTNRELVQETQNRLYPASRSALPEKASGAKNSKPDFREAPPRGAVKISWNTSVLRQMNQSDLGN
jgi:hypothetical protein